MKHVVKIIAGWSNTGGSTEAFINLTNALNNVCIDTTFYGPHDYHLNKCKADKLDNLKGISSSEIVICHFLRLNQRLPCRKVILNCHEKDIFQLKSVHKYWDSVVFLNENQRKYHDYTGKYDIIPNIKQTFDVIDKADKADKDLVAGIIGTIDRNKQVDVSIKRAIADGCEKVLLFGEIRDQDYFYQSIAPLLSDNVLFIGYVPDKQKMYNRIGRVYHSSISEVASLVQDECDSTGTKFFGNDATIRNEVKLSNQEILDKWIKLFEE